MRKTAVISAILLAFLSLPFFTAAATAPLHYGAWLPFWKKQAGAYELALHLDAFHEISPFSYEINADGTLKDSLKIDEGFWPMWLSAAKDLKVKIIPTVALLDGDAIHALLSDKKLRAAHIANIMALVKAKKFDGVDIDYENKHSETKPYFSAFIRTLTKKLHARKKILSCTVEGRTPPRSQFKTIPDPLEYANDYAVLNRYCDEVRVMAYDQGAIDLKLDAQKGNGAFYMPVADPDWVEKVLQETLKTISRKKVALGIPTYGYQYQVSWSSGFTTYKRLRSFTYTQATALATSLGVTPARNSAGELSFAYASGTVDGVSQGLTYDVSSTLMPPLLAPTLLPSSTVATRFVSFTDASAIQDKIALAKKYKLKGVILFKMDGETDPALWNEIR